mmetsp:Transcript_46175/g.121022  ORF Transcript_46175/g.121022 Transcript_46175/m.121022 type:complete len:228 (+) Transcript_46175:1511-2194(+)
MLSLRQAYVQVPTLAFLGVQKVTILRQGEHCIQRLSLAILLIGLQPDAQRIVSRHQMLRVGAPESGPLEVMVVRSAREGIGPVRCNDHVGLEALEPFAIHVHIRRVLSEAEPHVLRRPHLQAEKAAQRVGLRDLEQPVLDIADGDVLRLQPDVLAVEARLEVCGELLEVPRHVLLQRHHLLATTVAITHILPCILGGRPFFAAHEVDAALVHGDMARPPCALGSVLC